MSESILSEVVMNKQLTYLVIAMTTLWLFTANATAADINNRFTTAIPDV